MIIVVAFFFSTPNCYVESQINYFFICCSMSCEFYFSFCHLFFFGCQGALYFILHTTNKLQPVNSILKNKRRKKHTFLPQNLYTIHSIHNNNSNNITCSQFHFYFLYVFCISKQIHSVLVLHDAELLEHFAFYCFDNKINFLSTFKKNEKRIPA